MLCQNKNRKFNVVKIGPDHVLLNLLFNPLSLSLSTNKSFSCNPGLQGTVNYFLNCQQNHYSNHVLTQEKVFCLLLLHCTFQLLSYCKNHLHAK